MLFADESALTAHSEEALQRLMISFAHACRVWSHNESQEDQRLRTRRLQCPQRSNRRLPGGTPWT